MRPLVPHQFDPRVKVKRETPRVEVSWRAYQMMSHIVHQCPHEVGWLGSVQELPNSVFFLDKIYLHEQEGTHVTTKLSSAGVDKLMAELEEQGPEGEAEINRLRFWGHSHVNFPPEPSGEDEKTVEEWQRDTGAPYLLWAILNKSGLMKFNFADYKRELRYYDIPWFARLPNDNGVEQEVAGLLAKNFRFKPPKRVGFLGGMFSGNNGDDDAGEDGGVFTGGSGDDPEIEPGVPPVLRRPQVPQPQHMPGKGGRGGPLGQQRRKP